jgi:ChrR Cupin-like domain
MPTAFVGCQLSLLPVKSEHEFFPADEVPWTADGPAITQRVLSQDPGDGTLTRLARWAPGTDTSAAGVIRHEYYEEVYLLEGSLTDLTLGQTFTVGQYASRRPGMPHGPYRTDEGCTMLEIRYNPAR